MKNDTSSKKAPYVAELQNNLRIISCVEGNIPLINPDGKYGMETAEAVKKFQSCHGMKPTGNTDLATWNAIRSAAEDDIASISDGAGIYPFPSPSYVTHSGEKSPIVYMIQIILGELAPVYDGFETAAVTGTYDSETEKLVRRFQTLNRLPETGNVDKLTWDALAQSYNTYAFSNLYVS